VDLLVIMNHRKRKNVDQSIELMLRSPSPFPLDLLVKKPAEIRKRLSMGDMFLISIMEDGRTLYERKRPRVDCGERR
jgi:hypothetical protein